MNRRQRIIVSITGIFIVLLALVGLTYGYFLTQIQYNDNPTSITLTTANLKLVYGDDNGSIIGDGEKIVPDTTFDEKTFTVTNTGNSTIEAYGVVVENMSIRDVTSGDEVGLGSTRDGKDNDFQLVITCKNQDDDDCVGYDDTLPEENKILFTNSIKPGEKHTYSAVLTYLETGENQSADMNKVISGKFNIIDTKDTADIAGEVTNIGDGNYYVQTNSTKRVSQINSDGTYKVMGLESGPHTIKLCNKTDVNCNTPVLTRSITINKGETASGDDSTSTITIKDEKREATVNINASQKTTEIEEKVSNGNPYGEETFASKIYNNGALIAKPGTTEYVIDKRIKYYAISYYMMDNSDNLIYDTSLNDGLFTANDDYGKSYYFRGDVKNNYVEFDGMCFRIVRIQGDGSVKLVQQSTWKCSQPIVYPENRAGSAGSSNVPTNDGGNLGNFPGSETLSSISGITSTDLLKDDKWCFGNLYDTHLYYSLDIPDIVQSNVESNHFKSNMYYYGTSLYKGFYFNNYYRIKENKPSLVCGAKENIIRNGLELYQVATGKFGGLTADEVIMAGGNFELENPNYYLVDVSGNYDETARINYLLTPHSYRSNEGEYYKLINGKLIEDTDSSLMGPVSNVITLKAETTYTGTGDGTQENPYKFGTS